MGDFQLYAAKYREKSDEAILDALRIGAEGFQQPAWQAIVAEAEARGISAQAAPEPEESRAARMIADLKRALEPPTPEPLSDNEAQAAIVTATTLEKRGLWWIFGGIAATMVSYFAGGSTYSVFWGAPVYGGYLIRKARELRVMAYVGRS